MHQTLMGREQKTGVNTIDKERELDYSQSIHIEGEIPALLGCSTKQ